MMLISIFVIASCLGSFALVIIQHPREFQRVLFGRSHCEHCKQTLRWYDLIPIASFILLKGKCRYCYQSISSLHFVSELLFGFTYMYLYIVDIFSPVILWLVFILLLMTLSDLIDYQVADGFQLILFTTIILSGLPLYFMQSLLIISILLLIVFIVPHAFGGADAILIGILALIIPLNQWPLFLLVSSGSGLAYSLLSKQSKIPFIPFIVLSFLVNLPFIT